MEDFETQQADLRGRLQTARQGTRYQNPQGRMVGRIYVAPNPLEYLSEALRSASAGREAQMATGELKDLQGKKQTAMAAAVRTYTDKATGAPAFEAAGPAQQGAPMADPLGLDGGQAASGGGYQVPARQPDMRGAYGALMTAPDAAMRAQGMAGMARIPELEAAQQERVDARTFRQDEAVATRQARADEAKLAREARQAEQEATRAQRMQELQMRMEDNQRSQQERLAAQKELRQMMIAGQQQTQQMIQANRPERQAQIIDTDQGKMQVLPGGQLAPLMDTQGNMISGPKGPTGTLARQQEAGQALQAINQAEKLLPQATSSGLGSAVDSAAAFFGKSTQGAQAASQLKAIEGELVSKMPKMSGPQSDKDVALYKQMAGVIGDQTQPVATRQAALATVKEIQQRYAGPAPMQQPGQMPGPRPQNLPQTGRIRFDAQGNIIP
jgi:hypothetical protein